MRMKLKGLLKAVRAAWRESAHDGLMDVHLGDAEDWRIARWDYFFFYIGMLMHERLVCRFKGHDLGWEEHHPDGHVSRGYESWCTPDTGGEYFECIRCGWSHSITYY